MRKYLPLAAVLLLTGCASAVTAIVGQHVSDPTAASLGGGFEACEVTTTSAGRLGSMALSESKTLASARRSTLTTET
jgi:hypothetical protein